MSSSSSLSFDQNVLLEGALPDFQGAELSPNSASSSLSLMSVDEGALPDFLLAGLSPLSRISGDEGALPRRATSPFSLASYSDHHLALEEVGTNQHLFLLIAAKSWYGAVSFCDKLCEGIQRAAVEGSAPSPFRRSDLFLNGSLPDDNVTAPSRSLDEWLCCASNQVFYREPWGNTPLHAALESLHMLDVVEELFRVEREIRNHDETGVARVPLGLRLSDDDSTPFLLACSSGAEVSLLNRYLDEVEYYIEQKWVDPSCARMLVLRPDIRGTTPLMGWFSFHRDRDLSIAGHLELATRMVWFATRHVYPEYPPPLDPMLLHRCALIAPYCPIFMMEWLVSIHKDSADVFVPAHVCASRDDRRRLPLHNAIEADVPSVLFNLKVEQNNTLAPLSSFLGRANQSLEANRNEMIQTLLRWYPQAVREPLPNGRTPLCEAIARCGNWHFRNDQRINPDAAGSVRMLYNHAPEKLLERDTVTGLFPFMLMAASVPSLDDKQTKVLVLDTIYYLLRNNPPSIQLL
ncbi:hypothetical protein ACHAW6_003027 [Cyclotella cf. meneghiniana]